jgi:alpha-tubulin suppressor-like RCC1 family protein
MKLRVHHLLAPMVVGVLACNALIDVSGYRTCAEVPVACSDAGTDAAVDAGDASVDGPIEADAVGPCQSSAQCPASSPVCAAGACVAPSKLAPGSSVFACVVLSDGHLACWGPNDYGQLGDGTQVPSATPEIVPGLGGVTQAALAFGAVCALTTAGAVWCWGDGGQGVVPGGTLGVNATPIQVKLGQSAKWIAIGSGNEAVACALLADDSIQCWGNKVPGKTGIQPPTTLPLPAPTAPTEVHADSAAVCTRTGDGRLECWGENDRATFGDGTTTGTHALTNVGGIDALSYGEEHQCLRVGTSVKCWGLDDCGKVTGTPTSCGNYVAVPTPTAVLVGAVSAVSAANLNTCVALTSGHAKCWGKNAHGTAGNGTTNDPATPAGDVATAPNTPLTGVTDIAVHRQFACAIANANVYCWGEKGGTLGADAIYAQRVVWP